MNIPRPAPPPLRPVLLCAMAACLVLHASAQPPPMSAMAIARETSDPTSDLWYLFTELAFATQPGEPFDRTNQFTLELQPTMPVPLTDSWRLLNYPDLILASEGTPDGLQITGVKSFSWTAALSPVTGRLGWAYGLGPHVSFPVATTGAFGADPWQFGVGGVLAWRSETFLASAQVNSGWTTSGQSREAGSFEIQYNLQHFFRNGTQIGLGHPRVEYHWDRDGRGGWDVPVGVDVAKVFHIGRLPVKVMLEYDFYVLSD
ncbi:MAG TPA: hypothetical protein VIS74_07855, partial [Chthoniobacterales bacterium]